MKVGANNIYIYCILFLLFPTTNYGQKKITRGAVPGEIFFSTMTYGQPLYNYAIFISTDNGKSISLQYQNTEQPPPGIMHTGQLAGDATPGVLYNYGFGEMWVSFDYGITWNFREAYGSSGRFCSGCIEGEIYKNCSDTEGTIWRSIDYGIEFIATGDSIKYGLEVGHVAGELFGVKGTEWGAFYIIYSHDYGNNFTSYPIDSSVAHYNISYPEIFRGTTQGELFLVSWWPEPLGGTYKIFHSTNYGHTFSLKHTSDPINFFYSSVHFTAGRETGSFYVRTATIDESYNFTHLYIDYSNDYGQTFVTYYHNFENWVGIDKDDGSIDYFDLSLFPNPANESLNVSWSPENQTGNWQIQIHDIMGRAIESTEIEGVQSEFKLDVSSYEAGIYFVTLVNDGSSLISEKFIVNR